MSIGTRISVVGSPGSGKTTVAAEIASRRGLRHIELDAIHWGPDWSSASAEEMRRLLYPMLVEDGWVADGNYGGKARDLVWRHADTIVWLDLPKHTVVGAVIRRTVRRLLRHERLWNDNREQIRNLFSRDEHDNLVVWTWKHFERYRSEYEAAMADPALPVHFVRLADRSAIGRFLDGIGAGGVTPQ